MIECPIVPDDDDDVLDRGRRATVGRDGALHEGSKRVCVRAKHPRITQALDQIFALGFTRGMSFLLCPEIVIAATYGRTC
jgi:hypothetical protein